MAALSFLLVWFGLGAFFIRRSDRISGWLAMIGDGRHGTDRRLFWVAYVTCLLNGPFQFVSLVTAPVAAIAYVRFFHKE